MSKTSELTKTTKCIRAALARKFPGTKFRVIPHTLDVHINVMWSRGPTYEAVKSITGKYENRIKYIVHARNYGKGTDPNAHQEFIKQAARDLCALKNLEYDGWRSDAMAQRILSKMDMTQGYKGICEADLF